MLAFTLPQYLSAPQIRKAPMFAQTHYLRQLAADSILFLSVEYSGPATKVGPSSLLSGYEGKET